MTKLEEDLKRIRELDAQAERDLRAAEKYMWIAVAFGLLSVAFTFARVIAMLNGGVQ